MNSSAKTNAGKTLTQPPKASWWSENWKPVLTVVILGFLPFLSVLLSGEILFASDQMGSPAWKWYFDSLRNGELPQWNPYIVGGMPTYDANAGSSLYLPMLILGFLLPIGYYMTWDLFLHVIFAGVSAYLLVQRYFRIDRWISVALAVAYMLNTNLISLIYGGHDGKVHILSWLPLSLYFLLRALGPQATWKHLTGLALTVSMFIFTSHLQFAYFVLMGYFFVWLYFLLPPLLGRRYLEASGVVFRYWVPVLLGMGLIFFMIYPPMKYNEAFSIRGTGARTTYEHATSWSMHPEEAASLIVPEFGGLNENYWGRNYFKLNSEYPGLTVWFLGLLGLFAFRRSRWFWLWGGVGVLTIIYGLGAHTPFFRLFYEFVPGVKVFRAPSMMAFWLATGLLLMSAETLRRLTAAGHESVPDATRGRIARALRIAGFSAAGALAFLGFFPGVAYTLWGVFTDASQIANLQRQDFARSAFAMGALRAAALIALLTWATIAFLLKARRPVAFGLVALAVTVADLYWVNTNFIQGLPVERILRQNPVTNFFKADTSRYRILGLPGGLQDVNNQYQGLETIDGRMDHEMNHTRTYRGGEEYQTSPTLLEGLQQHADGSVGGNAMLDMLNVKYIAYRVPNDPNTQLAYNATYLPRAWFVPQWQVATETQAFQGIREPGFDPRRLAYITATNISSGGQAPDSAAPVVAAVEILRRYNSQTYEIDAPSQGILVIGDMWFPHWRVRVNGADVPLLRANYAFRGVMLEPGRSTVELQYSSPWLRRGLMVSGLSAVCLVALAIVGRTGRLGFLLPGERRDAGAAPRT